MGSGSESKNSKRIGELKRKYKFVLHCDLIPYENIPDTIREVENDLSQIQFIISKCEEVSICNACENLSKILNDITVYLKEKLEHFLGVKLDVKRPIV